MKPVGYYVNCDDAVCEDCAPSGFDDMVRVAILEMGWFADVQLDETEQNLLTASGWCDDPDDSEALSWLMESHENALPSGILSVWDGDCGTWSILDLRDDTLGPVLSQWNDAYPDWMV
jgi:hypothetical protein